MIDQEQHKEADQFTNYEREAEEKNNTEFSQDDDLGFNEDDDFEDKPILNDDQKDAQQAFELNNPIEK